MNTIAVDAMGGDSAPVEVVKGAIKAKEDGVNVVLCGDENLIKPYLGSTEIPVYHFPQVISMDEDPLKAIRAKKEASIVGCMQLLKEKKVEAVFSAGSTGATLISAITILGKQKVVIRPAIASILPNSDSSVILLDSGASLDVKPKILYQFAVMGSKLAEVLLELDNPRVGLLNNGEEESKGRDLATKKVDVFVTDGFTGNVVLKTLEGTAKLQQKLISDSLSKNLFKPLLPIVKNAFKPVKDKLNPDKTNASYLLGVDGLVTIGHGSSKQEAIKNGIKYTNNSIQKDFIGKFSETLNEL